MDFPTLLAMLQNPGEDGVPDTIYDDLTDSYNGVLTGAQDERTSHESAIAAVAQENDAAIAELNTEITRLKSINFDLLMQVQGTPDVESDSSEDESESDGSELTIDGLFK